MTNLNNFSYLAKEAYKSIPFISPALQRDSKGDDLPEADGWILDRRIIVLFGLSLGCSTYVPTLARLAFPYIVSSNSSVTFIAVASTATPATILIGICALGVLCYKLDASLTDRAKDQAAINQFINNEKPSDSVFSMIIHNNELIKLLLKNKDVDWSKPDSKNQTLIQQYSGIYDCDVDLISCIWDHTSDAEKVNFLISNVKYSKNYFNKVLNFLFDNNKIAGQVFSKLESLLTFKLHIWSENAVKIFSSIWDHSSNAGKIKALTSFLESSRDLNSNKMILEHLINNQKISEEVFSNIENKLSAFNSPCWSDYEMKIFSYVWNVSSDVEKVKALNSFLESPYHLKSNKTILEFLIDNKKNFPEFTTNLANILPAFDSSLWSNSEVKIFSWLWDHSLDKDKAKAFIYLSKTSRSNDKILNYLIDNKKIPPEIFTEAEQYELQNFGVHNFSELHMKWLKILSRLGFNIDAKGKNSVSVKERMLDDIYDFTRGIPIHKPETIISLINFVQSIEKPPIKFSFIRKIPTQHLESLQKKLEKSFPKEKIDKKLLEFFVTSRYFLMQISNDDNVEVGRIIWDKASNSDKKAVFENSIQKFKNSKLAIALMEDKKISAGMFTEKEQHDIIYENLINYKSHLNVSECFKLLAEIGFNLDAKNHFDKNIKDILLEKIDSSRFEDVKAHLKEALEEVEKAWKKQVIKSGIALKSGQNDQGSNLFMIPDDIFNNIVKAMADSL